MNRILKSLSVLLCFSMLSSTSAGAPEDPEGTFQAGVSALERGDTDDAIDQFELLADQGFSHPDASYNRGAAYVARARGAGAKPGDLGRAVAALSESLLLRPGDDGVETALAAVQHELARRRSRAGNAELDVSPSLGRAVTGLVSDDAWAILALVGSALLTLGLASRRLFHHPGIRLGGAISIGVGVGALVLGTGFTYAARELRLSSRPAVVVVPEAPLLSKDATPRAQSAEADAKGGRPETSARAVPEGAQVYVLETKGSMARIAWGSLEAWVNSHQLRVIGGAT